MKVAVLGVGGLGRGLALELASDPNVTELLLLDKRGERSNAMRSIGRQAAITAVQGDVSRPEALVPHLRGVDVAVNATLPEFNLSVMAACLESGCDYVDGAGLSPMTPLEAPGVLDQLRRDPDWRARGRTALVSMGSDPGLSNLMARMAADRLAAIEEIRVLKGATGGGEAQDYPLYSRQIFVRDALAPPVVWDRGALVPQPFVSGEEDYEFPAPLGRKHVYQFYHEEVMTLPARLGRPVGRVCYKHDINADLVRAVVALNALGLLGPDKRIRAGVGHVTFREAFLAAFPEPSTLIGPLAGAMAIVVEVRGVKPDGSRALVRGSAVVEHREANRRRGTTAERYVTAGVMCAGLALMRAKKIRAGVLAPEELEPSTVAPELHARGIQFALEELPA